MTKASDKLKLTQNIQPIKKLDADENSKPKTAPGLMIFDHQRAELAEAKLAALTNGKVEISELYEVSGRKRFLSSEDFAILKNNLAHNKLGQPIVVRPRREGGYEIISGHNRVQAYRELGRSEIEVHITDLDEDQVFKVGFYTNLITSNLSDYEKYLGFKIVIQEEGMTHDKAAKESGIDRSLVTKLINTFDKFSDNVKKILHQNPNVIGLTAAESLSGSEDDRIIDALNAKINNPKFTEKDIVNMATQVYKAPVLIKPSTIIRSGKKTFAKVTVRPGVINIKIENIELTEDFEQKIIELITQSAKNAKDVKLSHP